MIIIIQSLIALSVLIFVHELGHFLAAKKAGVKVEEFGIGLPPRAFGKKIGETIYSVNWLPIGGFVKLHGESSGEKIVDEKRAFINQSKKTRAAIAGAGVLMNFLFAILSFSVVYSFIGIPQNTNTIGVAEVVEGSPADMAGIKAGDIIKKAGGKEIAVSNDFIEVADQNRGKEVEVVVERKSSTETLKLTPRVDHPEDEGPVGIVITQTPDVYYPPIWQRPFLGIYYGFGEAIFLSKAIVQGLFGIAGQVTSGQAVEGLVGPVGIVAIFAYILKLGILPFINFLGVFSVNLAILNLIPFPPLDGFRIAMIGLEKVLGKRILPKIENTIQVAGMFVLLALMLFVTVREIPKYLQAGSLSSFVETLIPLE